MVTLLVCHPTAILLHHHVPVLLLCPALTSRASAPRTHFASFRFCRHSIQDLECRTRSADGPPPQSIPQRPRTLFEVCLRRILSLQARITRKEKQARITSKTYNALARSCWNASGSFPLNLLRTGCNSAFRTSSNSDSTFLVEKRTAL